MKQSDIETKLAYETVCINSDGAEISNAYTSDLLSDVMGNAPDSSVLITIQAHKNSVAVASLAGICAIILCNGRKVPEDMKETAIHEGISIFRTDDDQFTASYKIARLLGKE